MLVDMSLQCSLDCADGCVGWSPLTHSWRPVGFQRRKHETSLINISLGQNGLLVDDDQGDDDDHEDDDDDEDAEAGDGIAKGGSKMRR